MTALSPRVSVVLAVYNGAAYVEAAMRSVMDQTLRDIEIVVVDDASTDATPVILAALAARDSRIRIETLSTNRNAAGAANHGLEHARGRYVARMDADDLCEPNRLGVQADFLDRNPEITLCATSFAWMDARGTLGRRSIRSRDSFAARWQARFQLTLHHPTFMFRPTDPTGAPLRYDPTLRTSQDHDFVCRLFQAGGQAVCLPDVLLRYRRHPGATSVAKRASQVANSARICTDFQRAELPPEVFAALAPLRDCYFGDAATAPDGRAVFGAARAMLRHDIARHPDRAVWMRRQTAQLIAWSLQRARWGRFAILRAFATHGRDFILPAALRVLETQAALPRALASDPVIARA